MRFSTFAIANRRYYIPFFISLLLSFSLSAQHTASTATEDEGNMAAPSKKMSLSFGLISGFTRVVQAVETSEKFYGIRTGYSLAHFGVKANVGTYLNPKNLLGLTVDFSLIEDNRTSFNAGVRYVYRQPENESKVALYNPIEVLYSLHVLNLEYLTTDTVLVNGSVFPYSYEYIQSHVQSLTISYGFGVSFTLANKKSLNLELALVQSFSFAQDYLLYGGEHPNEKIKLTGFRFGVLYEL